MTQPGVKFRGGDRWLTPQPHEYLFRSTGSFTGGAVDESTVRTQVGAPLDSSVTIAAFQVPADAANAVLVIGVSAADAGSGATVNGITWNAHSAVSVGTAIHPVNSSSASLFVWPIEAGDLGDTSDIVVTFDAVVASSLACAYVVEGVDSDFLDVSADANATNSATIALPLTTTAAQALVVDWLTHVYSGAAPNPEPTSSGQTEVASSQVNDGTSLQGVSSRLPVSTPSSVSMNWGSMDASISSAVQIAVALRPYSAAAPSQPATAKLVVGYDFSGIDSTVTVTGAGISDVTDSSGNANSGAQATDIRRMSYGVETINGRLAAGTAADLTKNLNLPASITGWANNGQPPVHLLVVFQVATWTTGRNVLSFQTGGGAPRLAIRLSTTGGNRIEMRTPTSAPGSTTTLSTETTLTTGTTYLAELAIDSGGNASLVVNEGTPATTTAASSGEALTIRRLGDLSVAADMKVGACYVFNDALTAPELAEWRTFLKARWGYV